LIGLLYGLFDTAILAIDPDLLELFPDAEAVNNALRSIVRERSAPRD